MRHDLRLHSGGAPSVPRPPALGILTRLAPATWRARPARTLVAASLLATLVLPVVDAAPRTAEAMTGPISLGVAAVAMDPDHPDAADPAAGQGASSPDGSDGLIRLHLVPGDNELRYIMSVRTLGQPARQAACSTRDVTGDLVLTPDGAVVADQSKFVADMRTLHCAPPLRDGNAQVLLETQKYPTAELMFEQTPGLTVPLPVGDATFQLVGQQSVHGVTRHAEYATTATFGAGDVTGHATTDEKLTNFNIKPPQIGPLLQVEDALTIQFDFHATISGGPTNAGGAAANSVP
jgi:hypothetical protein